MLISLMASRWSGNKIYSKFCRVFNYFNMQEKHALPYSVVIPTVVYLLIVIISYICFYLCQLILSYKNKFSLLIFGSIQEKKELTNPIQILLPPSLASLLML